NQRRAARVEGARPGPWRRQKGLRDQGFGCLVLDEERILAISLVCESAATWLLPCELFVEQHDVESGRSQALRGEGPRRAASQNSDFLHSFPAPDFGAPVDGCPGGSAPDGAPPGLSVSMPPAGGMPGIAPGIPP